MLFGRGCFWADYNFRHGKYDATSEPDDLFNFQVSGPTAIFVVEKASDQSLRDVKFMHSGKIQIAGIKYLRFGKAWRERSASNCRADRVLRAGHAAIMEAGQEFGIRNSAAAPCSSIISRHAFRPLSPIIVPPCLTTTWRNTARISGAMPCLQPRSTLRAASRPIHPGLVPQPRRTWMGKELKFDHDFIGREALEKEVANPKRLMRTLVWDADDVSMSLPPCFAMNLTISWTCRGISGASCIRTR